jgi:hypothetical protein
MTAVQTELAMLLKVVLRFVPSMLQAVMQTTATRAAIRPYSTAVTPALAFIRADNLACTVMLHGKHVISLINIVLATRTLIY